MNCAGFALVSSYVCRERAICSAQTGLLHSQTTRNSPLISPKASLTSSIRSLTCRYMAWLRATLFARSSFFARVGFRMNITGLSELRGLHESVVFRHDTLNRAVLVPHGCETTPATRTDVFVLAEREQHDLLALLPGALAEERDQGLSLLYRVKALDYSLDFLVRCAKHAFVERLPLRRCLLPRCHLLTTSAKRKQPNQRYAGACSCPRSPTRRGSIFAASSPAGPVFSTTQKRSCLSTTSSISWMTWSSPGATANRLGLARMASYSGVVSAIRSVQAFSAHSQTQSPSGTCSAKTVLISRTRSLTSRNKLCVRAPNAAS